MNTITQKDFHTELNGGLIEARGLTATQEGNWKKGEYERMCETAWPILKKAGTVEKMDPMTFYAVNRGREWVDMCAYNTRPVDVSGIPDSVFPLLQPHQMFAAARERLLQTTGRIGSFWMWTDARDADAFRSLWSFDELSLALVMHVTEGLVWREGRWRKPTKTRKAAKDDARLLADALRLLSGEPVDYPEHPIRRFMLFGAVVHAAGEAEAPDDVLKSREQSLLAFCGGYGDPWAELCMQEFIWGTSDTPKGRFQYSRAMEEYLQVACAQVIKLFFLKRAVPAFDSLQDSFVRIVREGSVYHLEEESRRIASLYGTNLTLRLPGPFTGTVDPREVLDAYGFAMASSSGSGCLSRFISALRAIPHYPSLLPIEIDGATLTIVDSSLPEFLVSSRESGLTRAWCEFLLTYPGFIKIPGEFQEAVGARLLEYRLEAANGNA